MSVIGTQQNLKDDHIIPHPSPIDTSVDVTEEASQHFVILETSEALLARYEWKCGYLNEPSHTIQQIQE